MIGYTTSPNPFPVNSPSPMSTDQPQTPVSTPGGGNGALEYPPDSPPLRPVSDEEIAKLKPVGDVLPKSESERKPGEPRFPPKNVHGEKQCVNCQETDTPQWRGSLCNACALWKRSRGTDRPLPLLFPIRKRPRSPSPPSDEEEEDEMALHTVYGRTQNPGPSSTHSSPIHAGPQFARMMQPRPPSFPVVSAGPCALCGSRAELAIRGRPMCGPCARSLHAQTLAQQSTFVPSPRQSDRSSEIVPPQTLQRPNLGIHSIPPAPSREKLHLSTPSSHRELFTPISSATRPRFLGHPSGRQNPQTVYQTPVSPQRSDYGGSRGIRDPRIANLVDGRHIEVRGRRRSATVSGSGRLDELAHPSATVHLQNPPQMPPVDHTSPLPTSPIRQYPFRSYSPIPSSGVMPTSASKRLRIELSPSPPTRETPSNLAHANDGSVRPAGRRATVSGSPPKIETKLDSGIQSARSAHPDEAGSMITARAEHDIPSHREFMQKAEWLWGVMERTSRLLADMDIRRSHETNSVT